jgi:hypothetical protein
MGRQRAHRRREFFSNLYRKALQATPTTGFTSVVQAQMALLICARKAIFRCKCGNMFKDYAGFSTSVLYRCSHCGAFYRIEGCSFDRRAFDNRPNKDLRDWAKIGIAVELAQEPISELPVPTQSPEEPSFGYPQRGIRVHYEFNFKEGKRFDNLGCTIGGHREQ